MITSNCCSSPLVGCLAVNRLKLGGRVKHEVDIGCDFQTGSILGNVNQVVFHFSGSRAANFEILKPTEHEKGLWELETLRVQCLYTAAGLGLEWPTDHSPSPCNFRPTNHSFCTGVLCALLPASLTVSCVCCVVFDRQSKWQVELEFGS